jgi:hypothetical protein
MIWLFERGDEALEIETIYNSDSGEYLMTVKRPDGTHQTERFQHVATFRDRLERLEALLNGERWVANGSPSSLHDAWKV